MRTTCLVATLLLSTGLLIAEQVAAADLCPEEADQGFVSIFNGKNLDGWRGSTNGYLAEDGILVCKKQGGGHLSTEKEYGNFIFRFELKLPPGGNNGVGIRGMEIQILDDSADCYKTLKPCQYHGSIYCRVPAKRGHQKPVGQWNSQEIVVNGNHVEVTLNGAVIVDADTDHPALKRENGPLGFLGHGARIEFRNLRIKEL